jgi:hypothetical protein
MRTHLLRARLVLLSAVAVVGIAACGGSAATAGPATQPPGQATQQPAGGGPAGGGPAVDACALLTDDDIQAVTGYSVANKRPGPNGGVFAAGCEWELNADNEIVPPSIVLGIMTSGGKAYYESYFKPFNDEEGNKLIPGVGDEVVDAGFSVIQGVKGDAFFNLQYLGQGSHELELTKRLVTHL